MKEEFIVVAEPRTEQGTGASRRLRRTGQLPAIIYGAGEAPEMISVVQKDLLKHLETEAFYSQVLKLDIGGKPQQVILKALHRHPAKPVVMHADFQRVRADQTIRVLVPLHLVGEDVAPGVKLGGGLLEHLLPEVEVECFPQDLPQFLSIDVSKMEIGDTLHLSELPVPQGVELLALRSEQDPAVAALHAPRVEEAEGDDDEASEEGAADEE